jgi:hypothetical protein
LPRRIWLGADFVAIIWFVVGIVSVVSATITKGVVVTIAVVILCDIRKPWYPSYLALWLFEQVGTAYLQNQSFAPKTIVRIVASNPILLAKPPALSSAFIHCLKQPKSIPD